MILSSIRHVNETPRGNALCLATARDHSDFTQDHAARSGGVVQLLTPGYIRAMIAPPAFASLAEHVARVGDAGFWRPYVAAVLRREGLSARELVAGVGSTYPTFLCGDVVVKLFGGTAAWRASHTVERAVHAALAADPEIAAPRVLAVGQLYDAADAWPYLVTVRMPGAAWDQAGLSVRERLVVARDLGRQLRRVQALRPAGTAPREDWSALDVAAAVQRSALPPHLAAQVDGYLARLGPFDPVLVHGDLIARHVFVANGRLSGIIDWGDAMVTDRHYELAKLHLDLFDGEPALLRAFLDASGWSVADDFAHKALGLALYRQAHGLTQHHTMDVFYKLPRLFALQDIATLDALAAAVFAFDDRG
jgi:aminoglycoside phosphotransferase (APT) family kinase protein